MEENNSLNNFDLTKIPLVKVDRKKFLTETFSNKNPEQLSKILHLGPVRAGISKTELRRISQKIINNDNIKSTGLSALAGLPGGLTMFATVPADFAQFFGYSVMLAQKLGFLYESDLQDGNSVFDDEIVRKRVLIYLGVMFGVAGLEAGVSVLTSMFAKGIAKELPKKALTKTFWFPVMKKVAKYLGLKTLTKSAASKGISKIIPVVGAVVSGGTNWIFLSRSSKKLQKVLEHASFDYTYQELERDYKTIENFSDDSVDN